MFVLKNKIHAKLLILAPLQNKIIYKDMKIGDMRGMGGKRIGRA